jgi:hypothetical protein
VPTKVELFGKTSGKINREICEAQGSFNNLNMLATQTTFSDFTRFPATTKTPKIMFGNHSRHGNTWIGGPTHEIQR